MTPPENTPELRERLSYAWRAAGMRMMEAGYGSDAVTDTMLCVALAGWTGLRDRKAAVRHLRRVADQLEAQDAGVERLAG